MPDVKISGLPTATVGSGSLVPVVTSNVTHKTTVLAATQAALTSLTIGTGNSSVSVGSVTVVAGQKIRATGSATGGAGAVNQVIVGDPTFAADSTTAARVFVSQPSTVDAAYTTGQLVGYLAAGGTKGAQNTITLCMGFFADSSMGIGTNNYGFYSNLPLTGLSTAPTSWGFYQASTAPSYFAGRIGTGVIGAAAPASQVEVNPAAVTSGQSQGITSFMSNTGSTTTYAVMAQATGLAATGYNTGLYANVSGASNNYAVRIVNPSAGNNNWAIYSDATAQSTIAGNLGLGILLPTVKLDISAVSNIGSSVWGGGTNFMRLHAASGSAFSEPAIAFQEGTSDVGAKIGVKNTANGAYDIIFTNRVNTSATGTTLLERMRINHLGNVGIGTSAPAVALDVAGNSIRIATANTPTTSTAAGSAGQICWDATYLYICTTTGAAGSAVWKRLTLAAF